MTTLPQHNKGALLVLVLVFGTIFFLIVTAFLGFVVTQARQQSATVEKEQALAIAEAGINYAKWYLAHYPGDTTLGTTTSPVVLPYEDSESGEIGMFSLAVTSTSYCGEVASIDIYSTGHTNNAPQVKRTVYGRYAQPTVAEYAYIINSNVWAGSDRTIVGPYHSNGGVRMDGTNNSTVTSGQETWSCTSGFGCSPTQTRDGVFTTTSNPNTALFNYPTTPINFTGLTVDLATMKARAEDVSSGGIYIPPSGDQGYRITFNSDNTVTVRVVDRTFNYWGYTSEYGWQTERHVIDDDDPYATYTIDPSCPLIFVEDKVWLEGQVASKVTLAAADTDTPGRDPSIILNDNITYATSSAGLLAIAEEDVLVGLVVPNDMFLSGIFVAQNGRFGRNHYTSAGSQDVLSSHDSYVQRSSLTMNGTIVSSGRVGTKWSSGSTWLSGFNTRYNSYDRDLVNDPPPLAPSTSDDYKFIEWREED